MGGLNWAEHTVEIEAPIETCFEAIVDYESFPEWQGAVVATEILDRYEDGLGRRVNLVVDAKVRKVDYTLEYRYQRPTLIEWDFVEGNGINDADGDYSFEDLGGGTDPRHLQVRARGGDPAAGPGRPPGPQADPEGVGRGSEEGGRAPRPGGDPGEGREARIHSPRGDSGSDVSGPWRSRPPSARSSPAPTSADDESVRGAATEVVSATAGLARAVVSRSLGAAGGVVGRIRRLRP